MLKHNFEIVCISLGFIVAKELCYSFYNISLNKILRSRENLTTVLVE